MGMGKLGDCQVEKDLGQSSPPAARTDCSPSPLAAKIERSKGEDAMRMRVRRAKITQELRDNFELYGTQVVALALGLGVLPVGSVQTGMPSFVLRVVLMNQTPAIEWLREKRDEEQRQEKLGFWSMLILTAIAAIGACIAAYPIIKG
jgi:hypothetical protein